jgi:hypothetical protein
MLHVCFRVHITDGEQFPAQSLGVNPTHFCSSTRLDIHSNLAWPLKATVLSDSDPWDLLLWLGFGSLLIPPKVRLKSASPSNFTY